MTPPARGASRSGDERGQSETLGLVLVFGVVILGASAVVVLGSSAVGDSEQSLSTQRAEKVLTQFDSKAALVALGNTDVQSVRFADRESGRFRVLNGSGWLNVTIRNSTSGVKTHLVNQTLGSVTYDNGEDELAYQGGGVWRSSGNSSRMISPPEFHYRNGTLTLPIVNVTGQRALDGGAALGHAETVEQFPIAGASDRRNPLDEHRVFVVVRSDYYRAWGQYFEERTDGNVVYDHATQEARLELVSPLGKQTIDAATASRSASGQFELHGAADASCAPSDVYTNSYNSSGTLEDYCTQVPGDNGHVVYGSDVDLSAGSGGDDIRGNLVSGGSVDVSDSAGNGQPEVFGHINHTDACNACSTQIRDSPPHQVNEISGIATMHSINLLLRTKVDDLEADNDNADPAADVDPATDSLDFAGGTATLPAGQYYLEDVSIASGDKLVLDTSGGDVTIAVEGGIELQGSGGALGDGGTIEVQGDGNGKVYVQGVDAVHGRPTYDVRMEKNAGIVTGGVAAQENATRFRLYGPDNLTVAVGEGNANLAKFVGVVFAPPGRSGTGRVDIDGGEVFGGILTGTTTIDGGSVHYDEALRDTQVLSRDEKVVRVTYLHVTVNRVHVSNG